MLDKAILRRRYSALRDALAVSDRLSQSVSICSKLLGHAALLHAPCVALYAAIGSEVDLAELHHALIKKQNVTVVYPRVEQRHLAFVQVRDMGELEPGTFGIPVPKGERTDLGKQAVVLVPGLAFDQRGYRLGYGGGYYDRFLERFEGRRIGVAFDVQIADELPRADYDQPVDLVVTGTQVIDAHTTRNAS